MMNSLCLSACLLLLLHTVSADSSFDDSDDVNYERGRRGWSMMRLGRGLQMLRLGKRASLQRMQDKQQELQQQRPDDDTSSTPISPEQLRAMLTAILDETREREETRRHPPLPRYGRDLELNLDAADDLYPLFSQDGWPHSLPLSFSHRYSSSRFKRDAAGVQSPRPYADVLAWSDMGNSRGRAVALPRIGRYLGRLYKYRPIKAVPAPRIGRQDDLADLDEQRVQEDHVSAEGASSQYSVKSEQKAVDNAAVN